MMASVCRCTPSALSADASSGPPRRGGRGACEWRPDELSARRDRLAQPADSWLPTRAGARCATPVTPGSAPSSAAARPSSAYDWRHTTVAEDVAAADTCSTIRALSMVLAAPPEDVGSFSGFEDPQRAGAARCGRDGQRSHEDVGEARGSLAIWREAMQLAPGPDLNR